MIQLDIDPETERRVIEAAHAQGLDPSAYASKIVANAILYTAPRMLSSEEFEKVLRRLAARGKDLPKLPDCAYSRESFYQDHD